MIRKPIINRLYHYCYSTTTCLPPLFLLATPLSLSRVIGQVEAYGSFFENLVSLPYLLDTAKKQEFGIVIVLDFFEIFAFRPRQTLLYTLLDRLQTSKASVCLVGLSNRLDCVEYLEKRVKSRFSHRRLLFLQQVGLLFVFRMKTKAHPIKLIVLTCASRKTAP